MTLKNDDNNDNRIPNYYYYFKYVNRVMNAEKRFVRIQNDDSVFLC